MGNTGTGPGGKATESAAGAATHGLREIRVRVIGAANPDELRALADWLGDDDRLRHRTRLAVTPPRPGSRGPVPDALLVSLPPGAPAGATGATGAGQAAASATALAATVISWVRGRGAEICVELTRPDGLTVRLEARNVRALPHDHVSGLTDHVVTMLTAGDPG
jgi:hypothetical protein